MRNTTYLNSANPEYLNEIDGLDKRDIGTWHNVDGLPPDPSHVGGIAPRQQLRSKYKTGKKPSKASMQWASQGLRSKV